MHPYLPTDKQSHISEDSTSTGVKAIKTDKTNSSKSIINNNETKIHSAALTQTMLLTPFL